MSEARQEQEVEPNLDELKLSDEEREERARADETISDSQKCPECGAPVENLRATCPNCGHEYRESDYDDPEAGNEFLTGSEVDEQGKEIVDESGRVESQRKEEGHG